MQSTLELDNDRMADTIREGYSQNRTANSFTEASQRDVSQSITTVNSPMSQTMPWLDGQCSTIFDFWQPQMDLGQAADAKDGKAGDQATARVDVALVYPYPLAVAPASMRFVIYEQYMEPMSQCSSDERWCSALEEPIYMQVRSQAHRCQTTRGLRADGLWLLGRADSSSCGPSNSSTPCQDWF